MLLVFDAVGTLIRPRQRVSQTYFEFGRAHGSQLDDNEIKIRFASLFRKYFRSGMATSEDIERRHWQTLVGEIFDDLDNADELFHELWNYFADPASWCLFADVEEIWPGLKNAGLEPAIGSNFDRRLRKILAAIPPLDSITNIYISSEIGFPKPRSEFFEFVESDTPNVDQWVMIGDDPICDKDPARDRGWQAILIDRKQSSGDSDAIRSLTQLSVVSLTRKSHESS